jgi:DNA-binding Lrp family transcriptional regulator
MINLSQHQVQSISSFEEQLINIPEVKVGYHITGRYDYVLQVVLRDIDHLATLIKNTLSKLPGLQRQETFLIFSSIKEESGYSLDYAL